MGLTINESLSLALYKCEFTLLPTQLPTCQNLTSTAKGTPSTGSSWGEANWGPESAIWHMWAEQLKDRDLLLVPSQTRSPGQLTSGEPRGSLLVGSTDEADSRGRKAVWGASEVAQDIKATVTKPDNLSLIPETHRLERKKKNLINKFKGHTFPAPCAQKDSVVVVVVVLNF